MKGNCSTMKLQSVQEKITRYRQFLKYYGVRATWAYYLGNQSKSKYFDYRRKVIKTFVRGLRNEANIDNIDNEIVEKNNEFPKIIWTMWQQGEAQMPETVRASMKTIKDFTKRNGCEFHLLTEENFADFIDIPNDITKKYKKKELSAAHYSDIIRFSLLYQYGGIWMDATLFVSPYATVEMFKGNFFSLNHPPAHPEQMERTIGDFKWSGFFLAGQKGGSHFKHIRDLYLYYVRKYPVFIHYLMMDYFILSEYESNHEFKELVDRLPILAPAERVWFLRDHAHDLFDEKEWEEVLKTTPILKTTYKIKKEEVLPESYLDQLLQGKLKE